MRRPSGAQVLAWGGIIAAAATFVGGAIGASRVIGGAGLLMLLANGIAILVERTRPRGVPRVVCLCGSTRFFKEFQRANYEETMAGRIVLSVGFFPHASEEAHGEHIGINAEKKRDLDELHKRKIDLADEVLVLNVGKYIGSSTRSEIEYAQYRGRRIRYLEE